MMDLIVQEKPQDIESAQISLLLRTGHELYRGVELALVDFAHLVAEPLQRLFDFADHALPIPRHWRHVRRREFYLSLDGLRARHTLEHERPGEVFGAAAARMRLQVRFLRRKRAQHFERRRRFPVPCLQKCLLLALRSSTSLRSRAPTLLMKSPFATPCQVA